MNFYSILAEQVFHQFSGLFGFNQSTQKVKGLLSQLSSTENYENERFFFSHQNILRKG